MRRGHELVGKARDAYDDRHAGKQQIQVRDMQQSNVKCTESMENTSIVPLRHSEWTLEGHRLAWVGRRAPVPD